MKLMSEKERADLTKKEDLCIGVMNLVSLEEHLAFSAMKTGKKEYIQIMDLVRKVRIRYMQELVGNREGELWCISKHLLAVTMRLMETASKYADKDEKKALEITKSAFDMYSLFWFLQTDKAGAGGKNASERSRKKVRKVEKNK
ncbi:hypothetical protein HY501_00955 [Candidatus Woesearchaeota archaeon]|nr:hypothetical protein [Candidatus Woesearchaeota archaeon]